MVNKARTRFMFRRPSPSSVALYIIFCFAVSIVFFLFNTNEIVDGNPQQLNPNLSEPESFSSQAANLSVKVKDELLWKLPKSPGLRPCVNPTSKYRAAEASDHYITVTSNGGLNQMRTGISDMVAVARIMNATIVIPQLDKRSFWQDSSVFADIFDVDHFITTLQDDVKIVKELPRRLITIPRARKHFTSWAGVGYYEEMTHLFKNYQVVHVAKSDSRLANNDLPLDIQRLRCRALYQALRFAPPIESLGKGLLWGFFLN